MNNINKLTYIRPGSYNPTQQINVGNFKTLFEEELNIQFSKHASMRLSDRNINLSKDQLVRLENGINYASQKGINDSLVIMDNIALVVNISSRTVITALSKEQQNIFTNIDGAVIV